jgi:hypothetical protein
MNPDECLSHQQEEGAVDPFGFLDEEVGSDAKGESTEAL